MKRGLVICLRCLLFGALMTQRAGAGGGLPLWTNLYDGPGQGVDEAVALAVDPEGNVFVSGRSAGNGGSSEYATVSYSSEGVPRWTNRFAGTGIGEHTATAIAADSNGCVFVTGYSSGGGSTDYATVAYSGAGVALWTNYYNGAGNDDDRAFAVAVGPGGNVYVTGYSVRTNSPLFSDFATVAYSNAGAALWTNRHNGPVSASGIAYDLAVDRAGNVFVTGSTRGQGTSSDFTTIAYSGTGIPLWTNRYDGPEHSHDVARAVAVEPGGRVLVTGYSTSSPGSWDYATVAYSGSGEPVWTNRYDGPGDGYDEANAVVADAAGKVFVTGQSSASNYDYATLAYSSDGGQLWVRRYNGPGNSNDEAHDTAVDGDGNVVVVGTGIRGTGNNELTTIAYSAAGAPLWTNYYDGGGFSADVGRAVRLDGQGNVYVTGYSSTSGMDSDFVTLKYSSSVAPGRLFFQELGDQLVLSWSNSAFRLQSAPSLSDTFTNVPVASSPYTNPIPFGNQFFRLTSPQ